MNSSRLVSLFLQRRNKKGGGAAALNPPPLRLAAAWRRPSGAAPSPDDGVQASDLRSAFQHAERLRQRLSLLSRSQQGPESKATAVSRVGTLLS